MDLSEFTANYALLSDDELLSLWANRNTLVPEAVIALDGERFGSDDCGGLSVFFSPQLRGSFDSKCCRSAEEAHQSLDVLRHRCQEELLPYELQSAQAQATQSDLILEFREQGFHLFSFPLCLGKLWRVRQLPSALPGGFVHVDGKKAKRPAGALRFERTGTALLRVPM